MAIQANTGDALVGVQAVNEALTEIFESSVDLDFNDPVIDIVTTPGVNTVTQTAGQTIWNPQLINAIKLVDTNNLIDLVSVGVERGKELEFALTTNGKPIFYYVTQGIVTIIPTPDQAFTLRIFYQGEVIKIDNSNITGTSAVPTDLEGPFVSGIYARLRQAVGDPEWPRWIQIFQQQLQRAIGRNKFNLKREGKRRFRMAFSVDRSL